MGDQVATDVKPHLPENLIILRQAVLDENKIQYLDLLAAGVRELSQHL